MPTQSPNTGPVGELPDQSCERLCAEFENAWRAGNTPRIEQYLSSMPGPGRDRVLRGLLQLEIELRQQAGEKPTFTEYEQRFPDNRLVRATLLGAGLLPFDRIGDYKVNARLGGGGFGDVYRCWDERAERAVAIKIAHRDRFTSAEAAQAILHEARRVSQLHHPGIVDLYQVGEANGDCFLVYRFIDGMSLEALLRRGPILHDQGATLVAQVADALNHAHGKQLFHRDVKPANILLDSQGQPLLTDFGLAVREEDLKRERGRVSGTFPYMSPEQVRGEGHRIDGRSDVYSLGVVLYEILCERRPFRGTESEVLDQILGCEPQPPRQLNGSVHPDLERICLKAMAKPMKARFLTAGDMADDLRAAQAHLQPAALVEQRDPALEDTQNVPTQETTAPPQSSHPAVAVIPKGLRSFGPEDSDFFLELLPGPRDRHRLPDSIRFWKSRIESHDPDTAFSVGLVYGPSGCGKSSLIRAGLLPRLEPKIKTVYVEAARDKTKSRLIKSLEKVRPSLAGERSLPGMFAILRRHGGLSAGTKLLVVVDQFEQWLHAHGRDLENTQLVAALRQADGVHVQVLLMVRDDFWMSISRLFESLEINLDFEKNARAVDLFDSSHARRVLRLFGEAYNRLPSASMELTKDQSVFLDRAVAGLSQDGRVIPVRLSLFADLMKEWPWTPDELAHRGGTEGVGVRFLEQTFSGQTALPDLRAMEKPARAILQALLPESGTDIKGRMRSQQDLASVSALSARPVRFARLMEILDRELHIITPVDPEEDAHGEWRGCEGVERDEEQGGSKEDAERGNELDSFERWFRNALHVGKSEPSQGDSLAPAPAPSYQLTHDYLVPALRSWLTEERRKTWRGRAELCLEERTAQWSRSHDRRFLPSPTEFMAIALGVPWRRQSDTQKEMMKVATRRHALRGSATAVLIPLLAFLPLYAWSVRSTSRRSAAEAVCNELFSARAEQVPGVLEKLKPHGELAAPILKKRLDDPLTDFRIRLQAAYGLAALGKVDHGFIVDAIPAVLPEECGNITAALRPVKERAAEKLKSLARDKENPARVQFAFVLLDLQDADGAEAVLARCPNPTARTNFIHGFQKWHGDLRGLAGILRERKDPALRSGLCAALGLMSKPSQEETTELVTVLKDLYREAPDGSTHSAAAYALERWHEQAPPASDKHDAWFKNSLGMTMIKVRVGDHDVYVCDHKVTVKEFQKFMDDPTAIKPVGWPGYSKEVSPTPNCPVNRIGWIDAVLFCNWVSARESHKACYRETGKRIKTKSKDNIPPIEYALLVRCSGVKGYRLPTRTEWEMACSAGATTPYAFGKDVSKLASYAVYEGTRTFPDGELLPNYWGLFGMHGNVSEWCGPSEGESVGEPQYTYRGGSYSSPAVGCMTMRESNANNPGARAYNTGFRVVCECPP